jgi:glyoxylase-like metal-dependent hydrolase (beta-lactamase superfamily II)
MKKILRGMLVIGAALTALAPVAPAQAGAPMVKTQVPGYYRTMLGQFEITALFDGALELDVKLLKNAKEGDLNRLLARMFVGSPKMQTAVNAYLINTGSNLVLVDAGAAKLFGPTLGYIVENLRAAGYDPAQVDTVIITHLHPDHVGGLGDSAGQMVFPNATVQVAQSDHDFWMSQDAAAKAAPEIQPFFKMARDAAAPYQARNQWKAFAEGAEIVPGIRAVKAYGHTPGHTAYSVESGGEKLLIWGDVVHSHAVQFAQPDVAIEFDVDATQAVATRKSLMYSLAATKSLVAGMHLPFPGIGHVRADGKGIYSWVPVEFSPLPAPSK